MNGHIIRLVPLSPAWVTASNDDAAFPAANLADPQPKLVYRVPANPGGATAYYSVDVDLQVDTALDTLGLLYSNAQSVDVTWTATGATAAQGAGALVASDNLLFQPNVSIFDPPPTSLQGRFFAVRSFASVARRYVRFIIASPAGTGSFTIGLVAIGQTIVLDQAFNFDLGAGRKIDDLSDIRPLPGGELGIWRKARVPVFRATWAQLTDAELRTVWSLLAEIGLSAPLLLIEDPAITPGLQERIHYGVVDALDFYARAQVDKSSIELKVRAWL